MPLGTLAMALSNAKGCGSNLDGSRAQFLCACVRPRRGAQLRHRAARPCPKKEHGPFQQNALGTPLSDAFCWNGSFSFFGRKIARSRLPQSRPGKERARAYTQSQITQVHGGRAAGFFQARDEALSRRRIASPVARSLPRGVCFDGALAMGNLPSRVVSSTPFSPLVHPRNRG